MDWSISTSSQKNIQMPVVLVTLYVLRRGVEVDVNLSESSFETLPPIHITTASPKAMMSRFLVRQCALSCSGVA